MLTDTERAMRTAEKMVTIKDHRHVGNYGILNHVHAVTQTWQQPKEGSSLLLPQQQLKPEAAD